jgi:hypothetical protein
VSWTGADLRGRNLVAPKPHRPWSQCLAAARKQEGRYVRKDDRPVSRSWNFQVHLDQRELEAAYQFHHDWKLAGLRPQAAAWLQSDENELVGGQVPRRDPHGELDLDVDDDDLKVVVTSSHAYEGCAILTAAELRDRTKSNLDEKTVDALVAQYLEAGGTIKHCPPFMTRRGRVRRIVEYILPQSVPVRGVGVTDQPHATPLSWSQARYRRLWRWARKSLNPEEASLVERVILRCEPTDALPALKGALQKLAQHYEKFSPAEELRKWEAGVRRNLEVLGVEA